MRSNGYSIKEAASKLNISDKALYKRISSDKFNNDFLSKIDGKTIITEDGFDYLCGVIKRRKSGEDPASSTVCITEKEIMEYKEEVNDTRIKVYTEAEIDTIIMLREEVEFLRKQLEQQNINFQEQLKIQVESYQENFKIQLETIKSKEAIILNMQDIIKVEQENSRKILDYEERSKEVDSKLFQLRQELVERKSNRKKGFFSAIKSLFE